MVLKVRRAYAEKLRLDNMKRAQESLFMKDSPSTAEDPSRVTPEDRK